MTTTSAVTKSAEAVPQKQPAEIDGIKVQAIAGRVCLEVQVGGVTVATTSVAPKEALAFAVLLSQRATAAEAQ